jgi:hypothetical protein
MIGDLTIFKRVLAESAVAGDPATGENYSSLPLALVIISA